MAGRRGGGDGWHDLWSMIVALILLGVLMVGLVSSGGWNLPAEDPDDPDAHAADDGDLLDLAALRTGAMPRGLPLSD